MYNIIIIVVVVVNNNNNNNNNIISIIMYSISWIENHFMKQNRTSIGLFIFRIMIYS